MIIYDVKTSEIRYLVLSRSLTCDNDCVRQWTVRRRNPHLGRKKVNGMEGKYFGTKKTRAKYFPGFFSFLVFWEQEE